MKPSTNGHRETSPSPSAFPSHSSAPTTNAAPTAGEATANGGIAAESASAPAPRHVGMVRKVVAIVLAVLAYQNFLLIHRPIHVHEFYVIAVFLGIPLACIRHFAGRCPRLETAGWVVLVFQTLVAVRSL